MNRSKLIGLMSNERVQFQFGLIFLGQFKNTPIYWQNHWHPAPIASQHIDIQ